ncbi:hypothetical protein TELCIR_02181 [Teladorsagia circumcincta]|uniref:MRG domain-containing protein n=1 Tax=Teladorsagia circumcincta TaxID=45464 RepID=A0A2G9UZW9_TELCI|nr:hypothetical protein TELCIR_02181 [Teladorsagia circumcincta]
MYARLQRRCILINMIQKEIQEAQSSKVKRRKTKDGHDDDGRKSDAGSRASTPNSVPRSASVSTPLRTKIAKKRAEAGTDAPAATSTTNTAELENKSPVRERDPQLLQELDYCAEVGFSPKEGDDSAVADSPSGLGSSAVGLRDFFNGVLGYQLLYKFERPQYAAEIEKAVGSSDAVHRKRKSQSSPDDVGNTLVPSKLYGLPHLLRLIVRLTTLLRDVPWNDTIFRHYFLVPEGRNVKASGILHSPPVPIGGIF